MRDLARLRGNISDDKDLAREYQQLVRQAQQLDPRRWTANPELTELINGQVTTAIDQVELLLGVRWMRTMAAYAAPTPVMPLRGTRMRLPSTTSA